MSTADRRPVSSPAERAAAARGRAEVLKARREELARGVPASGDTVRIARDRVLDAAQRARVALESSAARHLEAHDLHLRAAAVHEQAAMLADDGAGERHQDAAAWHRHEADLHQALAAQDTIAAAP